MQIGAVHTGEFSDHGSGGIDKLTRSSSRAFTVPPVEIQQAINHIVDEVSEENLRMFLNKLVGFGSRLYRAPGMYNATKWLHDSLDGNGRLKAEYHNFSTTTSWGTFLLSNVILTLPGLNTSSDKIYYMYAHSDAVQITDSNQWLTNTPGADDDGSGCVAVLEAARILSRYDFHDTIKFAFFQAEEIGLRGSSRYCQDISNANENVAGGIDYDMIGHSLSSTVHKLDMMYNPIFSDAGSYMVDVNTRYDIGLTINTIQTTNSIASDIQSFYNRGFPSVFGIETDFSPYYHSLSDTVDKISFKLLGKSTKLAVATLSEWARLQYVDLSIPSGDLNISNVKPVEDEHVSISVNVTNKGNLNATNADVVFYANGAVFQTNKITVQANSTNSTTAYWNAVEGAFNISVVIDPSNNIVETDETNNTAFEWVNVNDRPVAVLTALPITAFTGDNITFNGSLSHDLIFGISDYKFSFGDGSFIDWTTNATVSHSYHENGEYKAVLNVRDRNGAVSFPANLTVTVLNREPTASPWSNQTRTFTLVPIKFRANAVDIDGVVTTEWYFDDSTPKSFDQNPVHSYSKSGIYDVELNIEDDDGAEKSYSLKIFIENRAPVCSIEPETYNGNITSEFIFYPNASDPDGTVDEFIWDFGDGETESTDIVKHSFQRPGKYIVHLRVIDDEGASSQSMVMITVNDLPPVADGKAFPTGVNTFENIYFNGSKSYDLEGQISYNWDFGDGNSSSDMDPQHRYSVPGTYHPILKVQDFSGQIDIFHMEPIIVMNRPPDAAFETHGNFSANGLLYFDGTDSSDPEGKIDFFWEFDDGSNSTGSVVTHRYTEPGTYRVFLTVTDEHGMSSMVRHDIEIKPEPPGKSKQTEKKQGDESFKINALLILNIILIILLIVISVLFIIRKQKGKEKAQLHEQVPTQQPITESGVVPADPYIGQPAPDPALGQTYNEPVPMVPQQLPSNGGYSENYQSAGQTLPVTDQGSHMLPGQQDYIPPSPQNDIPPVMQATPAAAPQGEPVVYSDWEPPPQADTHVQQQFKPRQPGA